MVTEFRLRTRPRFRELTQTTYVYPAEAAEEILAWLHHARHDVPPSVELVAVGNTPPLPPELGHTGPVLVVDGVSFGGGPSSLRALDTGPVAGQALLARIAQPADLAELRAEQIRANPEGHRYVVDNAYLAGDAGPQDPRHPRPAVQRPAHPDRMAAARRPPGRAATGRGPWGRASFISREWRTITGTNRTRNAPET